MASRAYRWLNCLACKGKQTKRVWDDHFAYSLSLEPTLMHSIDSYFKPTKIDDYECLRCQIGAYL